MFLFQKQGSEPQVIYFVNNRLQETKKITKRPLPKEIPHQAGNDKYTHLPQITKISTFYTENRRFPPKGGHAHYGTKFQVLSARSEAGMTILRRTNH